MTESVWYLILPFMMYPFICRQRFFYYLIGIGAVQFIRTLLLLFFRSPRPQWIWSDLQCYDMPVTFASPSGHAMNASFVVVLAITDTFFASNYSRRKHPSSNACSISDNMLLFLASGVIGVLMIRSINSNQVFLGKHVFEQNLFGTALGIWCALYLHMCWRDQIHRHITLVTQMPKLNRRTAITFIKLATVGSAAAIILIFFACVIVRNTMSVD